MFVRIVEPVCMQEILLARHGQEVVDRQFRAQHRCKPLCCLYPQLMERKTGMILVVLSMGMKTMTDGFILILLCLTVIDTKELAIMI